MNKIKCLLVDDEELARTLLDNYIGRIPALELKGQCKNPVEAMNILQTEKIDLLFLDIQMPELTGLEFLKSLPHPPLTILTTAYADYALESYALNVVDYLLKPIGFDRFLQAVNKAIERQRYLELERGSTTREAPSAGKDYITVKSEHKIFRIRYEDIRYIQSMREYVAFYLQDQRILSLNSLKQLEEELPADRFLRIHKSYIVAISRIKSLQGNLLHLENEKLPLGASYKEEVLRRIF